MVAAWFVSSPSVSACFSTSEKLINVWNYDLFSILYCLLLTLVLRIKKQKLLFICVCVCGCWLWTSPSRLHCLVSIPCDHTLKPFLMGLGSKEVGKCGLFVLCSDLLSLNLAKTRRFMGCYYVEIDWSQVSI